MKAYTVPENLVAMLPRLAEDICQKPLAMLFISDSFKLTSNIGPTDYQIWC